MTERPGLRPKEDLSPRVSFGHVEVFLEDLEAIMDALRSPGGDVTMEADGQEGDTASAFARTPEHRLKSVEIRRTGVPWITVRLGPHQASATATLIAGGKPQAAEVMERLSTLLRACQNDVPFRLRRIGLGLRLAIPAILAYIAVLEIASTVRKPAAVVAGGLLGLLLVACLGWFMPATGESARIRSGTHGEATTRRRSIRRDLVMTCVGAFGLAGVSGLVTLIRHLT